MNTKPILYTYQIYRENGTLEKPIPREKATLEELQEMVGGLIELVPHDYWKGRFDTTATVYCNEEGRLTNMEDNPHFDTPEGWPPSWRLVGPIVVEDLA